MTAALVVYTRADCALCDELRARAEPIAARHGVAIESVDIDADDALRRRYGWDVPVLVWRGREICRHGLDADALERALRAG